MINKKIIGFTLLFLILIISIGIVSAEGNMTLQSQQNLDDVNSVVNEKTFEDIQIQINQAEENDTIELEGSYFSLGKEIKISKPLTIQGKGNAIIDGDNISGIFKITTRNSKIILKNLTIINAFTKDIETEDEITYNSAINILKPNNHLIVENCIFINNTGSLINTDSKLTCKNSLFKNNNADSNRLITASTSSIEASNFTVNKDSLLHSYISNITNSNFNENSEGEGIGIHISTIANIINSNFVNNNEWTLIAGSDEKCNLINSNFENNTQPVQISGDSHIINCNFINSSVSLNPYWPEYYEPYWSVDPSDSIIDNSSFKSNTNIAVYTANNLKLTNSTFENNSNEYVGSLYITGATCTVNNCSFKNSSEVAIAMESYVDTVWFNEIKYGKLKINNKTYKNYVNLNDDLKEITILSLSILKKVNPIYNSGEKLILMLTADNSPYKKGKIQLKIFNGKKSKTNYIITNSKGIASFDVSKLSVGSHKIIINCDYYNIPKKTITIKVVKAKTTINAPKITAKYKKTNYLKVTVKHKTTKKPVKNTYIQIKISKKTYTVKTNSKGIAKINTKKLKIGKHKVTITSINSNYKMNGKSIITIKR